MEKNIKSNSGVALLMSLGLLALLSVVGLAFATNMRLGQRSALDFLRGVQVKYAAEAGMQRAMGELKYHNTNGAVNSFFDSRFVDPDNGNGEYWYYCEKYGTNADQNGNGIAYEYLAGTSLQDAVDNNLQVSLNQDITLGNYTAHYDLKIIDTGSQININDTNIGNLRTVLGNLCTYLGSPLDSDDGYAIFDNRPANGYNTKEEIKSYLPGSTADDKKQKYDKIKDFITVNSYQDPANNNKYQININTVSWQVVASVLVPILGDTVKAETVAKVIVNPEDTSPPNVYPSWGNFNWVIDNNTSLTTNEKTNVKNAFNPNRIYDQDNDIKFGFNSGGYYEIECLATLKDAFWVNNIVARKKVTGIVKIFDMWNQTTTAQFQGDIDNDWDDDIDTSKGDYENGDGLEFEPIYSRVTWLDTCPVNIKDSYPDTGYDIDVAETIPGSIKLGFWDDFDFWDENGNMIQDRQAYSKAQWYNQQGRFFVRQSLPLHGTVRSVSDDGSPLPDSDLFFDKKGNYSYPLLCLGRTDKDSAGNDSSVLQKIRDRWKWGEFSLKIYLRSYNFQYRSGLGNITDRLVPFSIKQWRTLASWEPNANMKRKYDIVSHIFLKRNSEKMGSPTQYDIFINRIDPWKWYRDGTQDSFSYSISCGQWGIGVVGQWNANNDSVWGNTYIVRHEGVRVGPLVQYTKNDDENKNQDNNSNHPNHDNDNPLINTNEDTGVGSDIVNNIEDEWNNIYYDPRAFPKNSYLCLGDAVMGIPWTTTEDGKYKENEDDEGKLDKFYEAGTYSVLFTKESGPDKVKVNAELYNYDQNNNELVLDSLSKVKERTFSANLGDANIAFYASWFGFIASNIRIVDKTGFYSFKIQNLGGTVEWGSIWATETMPTITARDTSEKIAFQISLDNTNWVPDVDQYNGIDNQLQPQSGSIFNTLNDGGVSTTGNSIWYRANFVTADPTISETPVLEDVWVTYLHKTKILYWKEGE